MTQWEGSMPISDKYGDDYNFANRQNLTVYLGKVAMRARRNQKLKELADQLADGNVSRLIQEIADGNLVVMRPGGEPPP